MAIVRPNIIQEVIVNANEGTQDPSVVLPISSDNVTYDSDTVTAELDATRILLASLQEQIDEINYLPISATTFSTTVTTAEIGSTISSVTFNWTLNKNPTVQIITGDTLNDTITPVSLRTYTKTGLSITSGKTFTLSVTDGETSSNRSASITFYNGIYYGKAAVATYNSAFVLALTKELRANRTKTFTATSVAASEFIFFCLPTAYGTPTFTVGGFEGGFSLAATITFTNDSGYGEEYKIYKSNLDNLGTTTVVVS